MVAGLVAVVVGGLLGSAAAAAPGSVEAPAASSQAPPPKPSPAPSGHLAAGASPPAPGAATPAPAGEQGGDVDLDRLLRLPNSFEADVDRRGGATASAWRARFADAHKQVEDAHKRLDAAEAELEKASGTSSAWQVSAPGADDPQTGPISLRLREKIRKEREAIKKAERQLRALEVEADLAAVPPDWRAPVAATGGGEAEDAAP